MHARSLPLALLAIALATSVATAQYSDDPSQQSGGHYGRMHGMGHGGTPPDPVVLNGPPAPDDFRQLVDLPEDKVAGYKNLYDHLMTETKPQRDSLAALRNQATSDAGDRASFEQRREAFEPLSQELTRRQQAFDDELKKMLDKDQWKRYDKWRGDQRKAAEQERQERWKHHEGASSTDGQSPT